jgi:hypothetical protein
VNRLLTKANIPLLAHFTVMSCPYPFKYRFKVVFSLRALLVIRTHMLGGGPSYSLTLISAISWKTGPYTLHLHSINNVKSQFKEPVSREWFVMLVNKSIHPTNSILNRKGERDIENGPGVCYVVEQFLFFNHTSQIPSPLSYVTLIPHVRSFCTHFS